jgi:hypothetical protein
MAAYGMSVGTPVLESVGPITFGPEDVLFVADNRAATIFALDVADSGQTGGAEPFDLDNLDARLASYLGCSVQDVFIRDLAVHPRTHNVYLSVMRGNGADATPVIFRVDRLEGNVDALSLDGIVFSEVSLADAPAADDARIDTQLPEGDEGEDVQFGSRTFRIVRAPIRMAAVTDLQYVDGTLLVAGMSNEEFSSTLRRIPFPFTGEASATSLEIYHVSHGQWETAAPIRTFVPYQGGASILASYTCTPLVHFPLADLQPGSHATGRTVAELGAGNQPLDIVAYTLDGNEHLLISHSRHPLMKVDCRDIDAQAPLTEPREPVGVPRQMPDLAGIGRMDNLNGSYVLAIQHDDRGGRHLRSLKTASL